jgi:hypothetical protein
VLLAPAVEAEVAALLSGHADKLTDDGRQRLVRHGHSRTISRAFALNPNFIDWRYARALVFVGEPARAIEVLETIVRLDPFPPSPTVGEMGVANYMLKRYRDAVHWTANTYRASPLRSGLM